MVYFDNGDEALVDGSEIPLTDDTLCTVTLWARCRDQATALDNAKLFSAAVGGDNTQQLAFTLRGTNNPDWQILVRGSGGNVFLIWSNLVTDNEWRFFALVRAASNDTKGYTAAVDDTSFNTKTSSTDTSGFIPDRLMVSGDASTAGGTGQDTRCDICAVKIWQAVALTENELWAEMHSYLPTTKRPSAFYPMLDNGEHLIDFQAGGLAAANGFNLTQNGVGTPDTGPVPPITWGSTVDTPQLQWAHQPHQLLKNDITAALVRRRARRRILVMDS